MRRSPELSKQFFLNYENNLKLHPVIVGLKDIAYELTEQEWFNITGSRFYANRTSFAVQYHYHKNGLVKSKISFKKDEDDLPKRRECKKLWPVF